MGLKMVPTTSFAEKSDQAPRFFVLNGKLTYRFTPALRDGADLEIVSNRR